MTFHGDLEIDAYPPPIEDAEQLCALRRKLGLSISEGARRTGINLARYCDLEQGRATAKWDTVRMLLQENV